MKVYIHHNINIANGEPYSAAGYIYNPFEAAGAA
jgi:hypothetical protein